MKERILGIDTGTNSIGWAVVDYDSEADENKYELVDKGVHIFPMGAYENADVASTESKASERTRHRRSRIGYWRRKLRKIALLKILIENNLCPYLSPEELKDWRQKREYPRGREDEFLRWQLTVENEDSTNPYYCRNLCVTKRLDLQCERNRYMLGRALYHINQRRGFLSNRKEVTKESEGDVKRGIDGITARMEERGAEYLGQYFWQLYQDNKKTFKEENKIRCQYTSRLAHYEKELLKICKVQGLSEELTEQLRKTIITQRPLKSQKHTVGKCVFEPNKFRCPVSHPLFEQYRMYQFVNNIKMRGPKDSELRSLSPEEKSTIIPLFMQMENATKAHGQRPKSFFKFEEIAKALVRMHSGKRQIPKGTYGFYKDRHDYFFTFNFDDSTSVSACPVTAWLAEVYEAKSSIDEWLNKASKLYVHAQGKNKYDIMNDVWHALHFFESEEELKNFAMYKLQLDEEHATMFSKIHLPSDYASLSLKAIRKILPYMKQYGMIYPHAVFLANIASIVSCEVDSEALLPMLPHKDTDELVSDFLSYDRNQTEITRDEYIKRCIARKYGIEYDSEEGKRKLDKLYHPSQVEVFPKILKETEEGYYQLGSPRTGSMRNPMAMRSLFRIRHVINALLREGKIDKETIIHIEFARKLNDTNRRAAIHRWQSVFEKKNKKYVDEIRKELHFEPTETDILKYGLWEEQNHVCLYTGNEISLSDLFDGDKYDIEHTVPRCLGGDFTRENLTICDIVKNRKEKRGKLPRELPKLEYEDIMERVNDLFKQRILKQEKQIKAINPKTATTREDRNKKIQDKHVAQLELAYWKGKYLRFTLTRDNLKLGDGLGGFSRRQGVDIGIISKYARQYLLSLFPRVYTVKGLATSEFRKMWGLQEYDEEKNRDNHCHHAIDAITIACIGKKEYDMLARYYHDYDLFEEGKGREPVFPKPWATFTQDVKNIKDSLLVSHYCSDNMCKQTRKRQRDKRGKLTGKMITGDTVRASLHKDTFYGAINWKGERKYVVRILLDKIEEKKVKDIVKNIVDDVVRQKVQDAIKTHGSLQAANKAGIYMNKDNGIRIKKVRVFSRNTGPMRIRHHRDKSRFEYKQPYYVVNDSNYVMGIYVGKNEKGKEDREFVLLNSLIAAKYYKEKKSPIGLLPEISKINGYPLKWALEVGMMVLLYDKDPEEIYELDNAGLSKCLYKVHSVEKDGRIKFVHHQQSEITGSIFRAENFSFGNPGVRINYKQLNALVEGCDFTMNELGEITFLHR
ncbi:MAG: CRISPR-associated protein Csn1 [Prevotellaceae bacterium]|nr:CRISPR-associated protein Csn1 [Prevotellaceae bacterium]